MGAKAPLSSPSLHGQHIPVMFTKPEGPRVWKDLMVRLDRTDVCFLKRTSSVNIHESRGRSQRSATSTLDVRGTFHSTSAAGLVRVWELLEFSDDASSPA